MASKENAGTRQQVSMAVIVPIIVVVVLLVGYMGYRNLFYTPGMASGSQMDKQTNDQDFLKKKAKECGGVFSKLNEADQKKVNEITSGQGEFAIRTMANRVPTP